MAGITSIAGENVTTAFPEPIKSTSNALHVLVTPSGTQTVDTELPAAAALADATANPTTPLAGSANLLFNGTTWDRVRGDTTNGIDVDVTRVTGTVTVDSELPAAAALADATANPTVPLVAAALELYNGTTWDRVRGDTTNGIDVDVTRLPAGEIHLGEVGGRAIRVSGSFTRPSNTTQYTANTNMADSTSAPTVNTITGCARANGGNGVILGASLIDSANQTTAGQFEAWVFDTTWTPDNDNAAFTPTDAECANLVAIIPLTTSYVGDATSGAGGNRVYFSDSVNRGFVCGGGSTSLYWALVVRNAYTPVSGEIFTLRLSILQN
jgi:hypothetical protein